MATPFIFGGDTGVSYAELQRRRAIAEARAKQARGFPKTIGEGIHSLGTDIGEILADRNLTEQERQYARQQAAVSAPFAGTPSTASPIAGAATPSPAAAIGPITPGRDQVAMALMNQGTPSGRPEEVGQENPTMGADTSALGSDNWSARENAIAGLESGGRYNALGPVTRKGDRAYGKYQVMGTNVGPWTEAALGQRLTPQQFLASDKAQDAVFRHRFGDYVNKYGEEGAARAWFGGEGNIDNPNVRDQLGTSVGGYGRNYVNRLGGDRAGGALALAAPGVGSDAPAILPRVPGGADEAPEPTPTDIQPMPRTQIAQAPPLKIRVDSDEYIMPKPAAPKPPTQAPMSAREIAARQALTGPYGDDPNFRRRAELAIAEEEAKRKFVQDRDVTAYNAAVQHYQQQDTAYQNWLRDRQKLRDEGEQRKATLAKTQQEVEVGKRPYTEKVDDRLLQWDKEKGTWKDVTPEAPGTEGGPPQVKLTQEQAQLLSYHGQAALAREQYNAVRDADKILAEGLKDELAGRLPFVGNAALSAKYRTVRSAAENLVNAQLRRESGAAIGAHELASKYRNLIPIWGDDAKTISNKREQRDQVVEGMYISLGKARPLADYQLKKRTEAQEAKQAKIKAEMPANPTIGKIYVNPETKQRRYWTGSRWEDD